MNQWTYSNEPKYDFIKLPDGTIINVACVDIVERDGEITLINMVGKFGNNVIDDPDGKIYAWFAERAVEVG